MIGENQSNNMSVELKQTFGVESRLNKPFDDLKKTGEFSSR
jgi:hypothetical protein